MIDDFRTPPSGRQPLRPGISPTPANTDAASATSAESAQRFRTPEEIAGMTAGSPPIGQPQGMVNNHSRTIRLKLFGKWLYIGRRQAVFGCLAVVVLLAAGGTAYAMLRRGPAAPAAPAKIVHSKPPAPPPPPKPILSPLTGMPVTSAQQALPVTAVMIENSLEARPQSGLKDAGVVFEAIAEGGITRFMALYQESEPTNIGPIRSARPYYIQWALPFDAGYAHVGGSPEALADIKSWGVRNLDQFFNGSSYHRIASRYAPHNVYTSMAALLALERSKGYTSSSFTGFVRKPEQPYKPPATGAAATDTRTPATSIDFNISGYYYNVHYAYDPAANAYKRFEGGAPHMDYDSRTQLEPKVVVALIMPYSLEADGYHSQYGTIGSGKMYVFQDGTVVTGTWSKSSITSQFVFTGDNGQPLALDPGQTWITVLGGSNLVSYK